MGSSGINTFFFHAIIFSVHAFAHLQQLQVACSSETFHLRFCLPMAWNQTQNQNSTEDGFTRYDVRFHPIYRTVAVDTNELGLPVRAMDNCGGMGLATEDSKFPGVYFYESPRWGKLWFRWAAPLWLEEATAAAPRMRMRADLDL